MGGVSRLSTEGIGTDCIIYVHICTRHTGYAYYSQFCEEDHVGLGDGGRAGIGWRSICCCRGEERRHIVARGASPSSLRSANLIRVRLFPFSPFASRARSSSPSLAMRLLPRSSLLNGHRLLFVVVVSAALLLVPVVASRGDRLPEFRDCLQVEHPPPPNLPPNMLAYVVIVLYDPTPR